MFKTFDGLKWVENKSIRQQINIYKKIVRKDSNYSTRDKQTAAFRLKYLLALNARTFTEPTLIVTNDKLVGGIKAKPRGAAVIRKENNSLWILPIRKRTSKAIIRDDDIDRQMEAGEIKIDMDDVYETKLIPTLKPLTENEIRKIKHIHK